MKRRRHALQPGGPHNNPVICHHHPHPLFSCIRRVFTAEKCSDNPRFTLDCAQIFHYSYLSGDASLLQEPGLIKVMLQIRETMVYTFPVLNTADSAAEKYRSSVG